MDETQKVREMPGRKLAHITAESVAKMMALAEEHYDEGYKAGYKAGYKLGYELGYEAGYEAGH